MHEEPSQVTSYDTKLGKVWNNFVSQEVTCVAGSNFVS
jgi:hypothetical protein